MPTAKTYILEDIFKQRFNHVDGSLTHSLVTLADVSTAIMRYNDIQHASKAMKHRKPGELL